MITYLSSISSVFSVLLSEFSRLGNYLDAYPVVYMILGISVVLDTFIIFQRLSKN